MGDDGHPDAESYAEETTLQLDNDGNAFVVLIGNSSCAAGTSLIEASLENAPYTTYTTDFTIEPPQPYVPQLGPGWATSDAMGRARERPLPGLGLRDRIRALKPGRRCGGGRLAHHAGAAGLALAGPKSGKTEHKSRQGSRPEWGRASWQRTVVPGGGERQLEEVMERRNLLAGLAVLALSLFVLSGTAFAHATHHKKAKPHCEGATSAPETCVVHALPSSFMDQGEFGTASSVADIIEVECEEVYAEKYVRISANELYSRCDKQALLADAVRADRRTHGAVERPELLGANSTTTATPPRS